LPDAPAPPTPPCSSSPILEPGSRSAFTASQDIGVGDHQSPQADGKGVRLIDNIRLRRP